MANQTFFGAGTYTWEWPVGVTQVTAECLGGGGFGGVARGNPSTGGGGKGGSYARKVITKGVESSLTIDVGRGGLRTVGASNVITALSSLPSTITQNGSIVCSGAGGSGGFDAVNQDENGAGGAALLGSNIGDVIFVGGNGSLGTYAGPVKSGAGGGSAGSVSNGGAGGHQNGVAGTAGTGAFLNGTTWSQAGAAGVSAAQPGLAPPGFTVYGGGGSGSNRQEVQSGPWGSGGAGKEGVVLLTWIFTDPLLDQNNFRFYKVLTGSATPQAIAAQNVNTTWPAGGRPHIRLRMQSTNPDGIGNVSENYPLYRSVNGGAYVSAGDNAQFGPLPWGATNLLGTGTGTFHVPGADPSGNKFPGPGGYTEFSYEPLIPVGLVPGDTVDFRSYKIGTTPNAVYTRSPRITVTGPLVLNQTQFRFYRDDAGSESSATPWAPLNTNIMVDERTGDVRVTLRLQIQETSGSGMGIATDEYALLLSKNGGPYLDRYDVLFDWATITTPTNVAGGTPTSNQLGLGSGTFYPGQVVPIFKTHEFFGRGGYTEMVWAIYIYANYNLPGDTIDIRLAVNDVMIAMSTSIPRITMYAQPQQKIISTMQAIPRSRFY